MLADGKMKLVLALLVSAGAMELSADNFKTEVFESGKNAFVKFLAPWCAPPSRQRAPVARRIAPAGRVCEGAGHLVGGRPARAALGVAARRAHRATERLFLRKLCWRRPWLRRPPGR